MKIDTYLYKKRKNRKQGAIVFTLVLFTNQDQETLFTQSQLALCL